MGLFDFITKYRERKEERERALAKREADLLRKVYDWVREDVERRVFLVCIVAVVGAPGGIAQQGIEGTEEYWRWMMTERDSPEQSLEEAEG